MGCEANVVFRKVLLATIRFGFYRFRYTRPVGARRAPEDAKCRFPPRLFATFTLPLILLFTIAPHVAANHVGFEAFFQSRYHLRGLIEKFDQIRKAVPKKPEMRTTTSTRGRPSSSRAMISKPLTLPLPFCQMDLTAIR